ncbi:MAG: YbaK/EbsC family protein [Candidatus Nealsonbacteria bacterium]|nr:YbaK/EbsC family protein [Candidatus Nealsonbacteria bacterium]
MADLNPKSQKIRESLESFGLEGRVLELPQTARTAADAARALGCQLGQIAKSIVFKTKIIGRPVLVIASGSNRIDEEKIARVIGEGVEKAEADFVLEKTGYVIGGVPPLGHREKIQTLIDEDLGQYEEIWAAAGTSHAVFKLTPSELTRMTQGETREVKVSGA